MVGIIMIMTKRFVTLLLLAHCVVLAASCSTPKKEKETYYQNAMEYISQNKQEAAILELRSAIQIDAKYADARYQLGLLYLKEGEIKNAFAELLRAGDLDPDNLDANLKVAHFYLLSKKKEESRQRIELILEKEPSHRDALALLANLELIEGKYDEALAALGKIGEEVEKSDELLNIKGRIHAAQQQWDAAENAFRKAIAVNEANFTNYETLLLLFEEKKDQQKSKIILDDIIEKFQENPKAHLLLAGYYKSTGNKDQVAVELQKVIELVPDNPRFRLQLADFYQQNSQPDNAEETLLKARTDITDNPDIIASLATHYFEQQEFDEARSFLDELNENHPGHGTAKLLDARFLLKEGKARDAVTILKQLNTDFPAWPPPKFYLGVAHYSLGEIELAQQAVVSAIQKNGQISEYHTLLAQIFQVQGSFEDAKKESAMALRLNPKNLSAAIILSRALIGAKQYTEAVTILTDMKSQVPNNQEILKNLTLAFLGANEQQQGEEILTELLQLVPGDPQAIALFINLRYKTDLSGAESFVRQQMQKAPADARLYLILGSLLEKQTNDSKALIAYEKAQEIDPDLASPYLAAAKLLTRLEKKEEAFAKFNDMIEKIPESLPGHMGIASLLHVEGDFEKAAEQYRKVLKIKEGYSPAANNLAWLIASDPNGDLGEALMLAMTAKQASPDDPHVADTLGWVHYQRRSYSLAIAQFEHALRSQPDNPIWSYHLALAQKGNNNKEAAIQILERLLERNADFSDRDKAEELLAELTKA
jgi:tetratricopeptide (TPR) repeat protein